MDFKTDGAVPIARSFVGRRLGEYECLERLGSGGMADVYLARRRGAQGFRKLFAIKVIGDRAGSDIEFRRMFMREAKIAATLDHPNVAQVVDFGRSEGDFYLVMDYIDGPTLLRILKRRAEHPLPLPVAISMTLGLCSALDYVHERAAPDGSLQRLVHRDVSPSNVMLTRDGTIKLVDFGIAKPVGGPSDGTTTGVLKGKVGYMSPEQVRGEPLDRRSDIFSVGILLYELTTGRRCFFSDSMFEVLNKTQRADFEPPTTWVPDYPRALELILRRALARDVDDRFATAQHLRTALEDFALERKLRVSSHVAAAYLREAIPVDTVSLRRAAAANPTTYDGEDLRSPGEPSTDDEARSDDSVRPAVSGATLVSPVPRGRRAGFIVGGLAVAGLLALLASSTQGRAGGADLVAPLLLPAPAKGLAAVPPATVGARAREKKPAADSPSPAQDLPAGAPPSRDAVPEPSVDPGSTGTAAAAARRKKRRSKFRRRKRPAAKKDRDALLPPSAR